MIAAADIEAAMFMFVASTILAIWAVVDYRAVQRVRNWRPDRKAHK